MLTFQNRLASTAGLVFAGVLLLLGVGVTVLRSAGVPAGVDVRAPQVLVAPIRQDAALPRSASFQDAQLDVTLTDAPTGDKAQSKLWFAHGSWWALMLSPTTAAVQIFRLDWDRQTWIDTGTVVDERSFSHADVLADGDDLYVVSAGPSPFRSHAARFLHLRFQGTQDGYAADQDAPVSITDTGVRSSVLVRDDAGAFWIAYLQRERMSLVYSADGVTFSPAPLPPGTGTGASRVALTTQGSSVTLLWTDPENSAVFLSRHAAGADAGAWTEPLKLVDGLQASDDHLNVKTAIIHGEERLYLAVKTSLDESPTANPNSPQVLLVEVTPDDQVTRHLFGRVRDRHTRPIVLIDEKAQLVYVVATAPFGGGRVYYKRSPLDPITFAPGRGTPLIRSNEDLLVNDATSTKQNVGPAMGLVVLAWSSDTGRYLHGVLDLGGAPWSEPSRLGVPQSPGADGSPPAPSPPAPATGLIGP